MKKAILILLLIVIAGGTGLTLWGSLRAKQAYRAMILTIAESPDIVVLETSYEGGWLRSRAHASLEIRGALGDSFQHWLTALGREGVRDRIGVRMDQTIEHGYPPLLDWLKEGLEGSPVLGRVTTHVELDQETQSELSAVLGRLPPVAIDTLVRASGIGESTVEVPAQRLESKLAGEEGRGWLAEWRGLDGSVVYTTDLDHLTASFRSAGIEGGSAGSLFALRDLEWSADLSRDRSGLLVGQVNASIGSFRRSSREEGGPSVELDRWRIDQSSLVEAGSFNGTLEVGLQEMRVGDRVFGPGRAELQLRNLDARSLARLQSEGAAGFSPLDPQSAEPATAEGGATELLPDLVARSPHLELRTLHLSTPSGDLQAHVSLDLDGSRPELLRNVFSLFALLEAHAEFECPEEILNELYREREEELAELRRQGWVLLDEERYRSRLELDGGELVVNGLPKSLGELLGQPAEPAAEVPQISAADPLRAEGVAPGPELLP